MSLRSILSKGFVLVMLIVFSLIASSCSWFGGGEDESIIIDEVTQEKRVGVLKSLGGITVGEGTHLLEMDDGTTMRLRSTNINLDSEKYLSKKVEVRGYVSLTDDGKNIMEVLSIDIAEEDDDEEDKKEGEEKEYKNADLGFKLTYLDNWEVREDSSSVTFTAPLPEIEEPEESEDEGVEDIEYEPDVIVIRRLPNPDKRPLEMYLQLPADPNELITLGYTQTKVGVDQLDGLKKQSADLQEIDIYLSRGEYIYQFTYAGTDNPDSLKNRNTYFSIVSSFQFIGFSPEDDEKMVQEDMFGESISGVELDTVNNIETDTPSIEEATAPEIDTADVSSSYGIIAQYIGQTINTIAPEDSESGSWSAYSFEFVDPNYVYVDYSDGIDTRRVLLTYDESGSVFDTDVIGYFEPGETTSWTRVSGDNPVANEEKTVLTLTDEGVEEETVVKEGYRYFESLPYDFMAQYPSSWYYSGHSGSEDVIHHYGFSNEPVEADNELVSIDIISGSLPSGSSVSVGSNTGVKVLENGEVSIYIEREDGKIYKIHGDTSNESYVMDIASSITNI